jgi:beta-glucuronidase
LFYPVRGVSSAAERMTRLRRRAAHRPDRLALAIALALAASVFWLMRPLPDPARSQPATIGATRPASVLAGPGGRTALVGWRIRRDGANRGLARGWQHDACGGRPVSVPSVVDPSRYKGRAALNNYDGSVVWYCTELRTPSAGAYALEFQSANFRAGVWIDGARRVTHAGSYLPFQARAQLSAGVHTVVVRVDWRDPSAQSRAGFHRTWFNWGGLDGEVTVRRVLASELSDPTIETTLGPAGAGGVAPARVKVGVEIHNRGPARTLLAEGSLVRGAQSIALRFPARTLAAGQTASVTATATVPEPALWSPSAPNLYQLSLAVPGESSFSARVGLRQLRWSGGRIYLNGERLRLHGATVQQDALGHGDALGPRDEDRIVGELQAIGANAARAQHPLDPGLLERLDAAGILVWQGIGPVEGAGNWHSRTPALLGAAERRARASALAEALHPSIIAWNLVDEVAGNGHDRAEVSYVRSLSGWLHAHDRTRMVAVDVWGDHPPTRAGPLYGRADAVAETDYTGWYDQPHSSPARQRARMRARLAAMARTFAGKVLVISEFGAESNALGASARPGGYGFQSRLLARHVSVYEADPALSGMLVWLLRDYPLTPTFQGGSIHRVLPRLKLIEGLNQKGLFTYAGAAKPAAGTIARLFKALARG